MQGRVTISHAFALSSVDRDRQAALIELLAANDIALATIAPGNREPLPLEALRAAGVRVGLGQDGIRDYWSPYGNGDVLERTWQLAFRNSFRRDELVELCVDAAARGGRSIVDGHAVGARGDARRRPHGTRPRRRRRPGRRRRRHGDRRDDGPPAAHARRPRRHVVGRDGHLV